MKQRFTQLLSLLFVLILAFSGQAARAQTGVLNYQDPIVLYNAAAPPTMPALGTLAKWVKTTRVSYNTDDFKAYIFNDVQFRLKWPKSYTPGADGKTYPLYLFFHGVGEAGTWYDNEFQFAHGGDVHQAAVNNGTYDGFLLYPQSANASGGWNQQQLDAIAQIITNYLIPEQKVDPNRICVNGLSGGGDATWQFSETHPTLSACFIPMSAANISDEQYNNTLKFTPIWLFQGGLDTSPDPSTTQQVVNAYLNVGSDLKYTIFPNDGHDTWDDTWRQTDYFPFMLRAHQANPWVLTGKNQFCPSDVVSATIGVVGGFTSYQWRKNGTVIPGANSNTLSVTTVGTYDCAIERGTTWSVFSPTPMVISIKAPTVSPNIQVNGLASSVLPAPDGSTSVSLMVPTGYTSYTWERVDSPAGHPTILSNTTNILTGATPGQYAVEVTEQFGCSSSFSNPFTVEKSSGPTPPQAPTNLLATTISKTQINLTWNENAGQPNPETNFEIYQGASTGGPFKLIGFSNAGVDNYSITGLNPKTTYFYIVRAVNATAGSATAGPSSAQTQADNTPPTAAGNLRTGLIAKTSVQLIWDPATDDVGITNYDIYVNGNKAYTVGNIDTFTVYNLVNGQNYSFTIKARDFAGNIGPFSNQVASVAQFNGLNYKYYSGTWNNLPDFNSLTPLASGTVTNVNLNNALSTVDYGFLWTGFINVPVTGQYTFQTSSDDGSALYIDVPYSNAAVKTVNNDGLHGTQSANSTTMTLTAGVHTFAATYFQNGGGVAMQVLWQTPQTGGQFVPIPDNAFTQGITAPGAAPTPPSSLTATAASAKKINLTWQDNSSNETGFQIFRSTSATSGFAVIATVKPNRTTYSDSSLNASTTYYYKIQAINQYGSSKFNAQDSSALNYALYTNYTANDLGAIATSTPAATGTATNFTLGVTSQTQNFALRFNGFINIPTTDTYTFWLNSDDGSNMLIDGTLLVNDDGLHAPQDASGSKTLTAGRHSIQVNFFQQGGGQTLTASYGNSHFGRTTIPDSLLIIPPTSATTQALPALPADPSGLAGASQGPTHAGLTWTNNATNATGFEVWRSPISNTNYILAATLPVVSSYTDSGLLNNTLYFYKVRAINEGGVSNFSNEISLTTSNQAVTTVTLTPVTNQAMVNDTTLTLSLSAGSSSVGAAITFTAANLPVFATLTDNHNGTASFALAPNSAQLGTYSNIILKATDAFGGSMSDTFSVTVGGRNLKTVQVTMNVSNNPVSLTGWNSMNVNGAVAGTNVTNFKDVTGAATTEGISLTSSWDGAYATGMNTGNNSGIYPDLVLRNFYFGSTFNNYNFKVTGLSSSKKYALVFFAGYPWGPSDVATYGNMITNYTVGSQTVTLNVANNISNTVQLSGLSPDATGAITVTINKPIGSAYCLISDLQILSYDAPVSVAALIPPSNLTANGATANSINLNWTNSPDTRTGLEVWRSTNPGGTFTQLATVAGNATTYTDASLPSNSTYFYEVREVVNTTSFSNFSNIAGGSTIQYTVNLSLNSQTTGAQAAPWNDVNFLLSNGSTVPNLIDMNSNQTGINFNVKTTFTSFNDQLGLTTGNNSGVVPDNVMKVFYYNSQGDTARVSVSGLPRNQVFNFGFYAGTNFSNTNTVGIYQIGSQAVQLNALNNTTNMVFINGVKPDSTGTVNITFYASGNSAYVMWNSLTIQGMPSPDVIAADSAGTSGTIATGQKNSEVGSATAATFNASSLSSQFGTGPRAFPNPFSDIVTVQFDLPQNTGKFSLVVVDITGRILRKEDFSNQPAGTFIHQMNLGSLNKGVYFIQAYGLPGDKPASFRLIKVK